MKKMTQEEFDAIERNAEGIKEIPPFTDMSDIKSFGERCSFGSGCSFGERCTFGECCLYCNIEFKKYYQFGGFGSVDRTTRVYLLADNSVLIECGCQIGLKIDEFKQRVESEYSSDTEHRILYLSIIQTIESIIAINNQYK